MEISISDGKVLPKGSTAIMNILLMGHCEKLWDDPEEFIPERFLHHDAAEKSAFMSFGKGPRNCKLIKSNFNKNFVEKLTLYPLQQASDKNSPCWR